MASSELKRISADARFHEDVLITSRAVLQRMLQRLYEQSALIERGQWKLRLPPLPGTLAHWFNLTSLHGFARIRNNA